MKLLRIAARTSDLARIQAHAVGEALQLAHPGLVVQYAFRKSLGDLNQTDPLWQMPEKGVFTEDFRTDLLAGKCDLVVHSWKDLPVETRPGTAVVATRPREDVRDLLIFRTDRIHRLATGAPIRVLSSSPRRAYNLIPFLRSHLPHHPSAVEFHPVRGNIPTRLRKLFEDPEADGLVLAKAALDRILTSGAEEWADLRGEIRGYLAQSRWMVLPVSANPPAAAQGALAIEIREDRSELGDTIRKINCAETFRCVNEERSLLRGFGGGCHQRIGIALLARPFGMIESLRGLTDSGEVLDAFRVRRAPVTSVDPSRLWPRDESEVLRVFEREEIPAGNPGTDLWVSKAPAFPEGWTAPLIWTAGLDTWGKLAARGVWVNGSAEGLGEAESPRVETLLGRRPNFTKLAHTGGVRGEFDFLATYRLIPREVDLSVLRDKTHFYWMSGSLFQYFLERMPRLAEKKHACGPGHTAASFRGMDLTVYANIADWRRHLTGAYGEEI